MENSISEIYLHSIIRDFEYVKMGKKTTVCLLTLRNGHEVVGVSACVDPKNFDEDKGKSLAYDDAFNKLWALEGYALQERLYRENRKAPDKA